MADDQPKAKPDEKQEPKETPKIDPNQIKKLLKPNVMKILGEHPLGDCFHGGHPGLPEN